FNLDDANSGYAVASENRGSLSHTYNPGQQITFRAWGRAPAGNCNDYEGRLFGPDGTLIQSGTFSNNSYWLCQFSPTASGVHRIEVRYMNATGGANPASGAVSYFIP